MTVKLLPLLLMVTVLPARADAQSPDPRAVLTQAQTALQAVRSVMYTAESSATGMLAARVPLLAGEVWIDATERGKAPRLYLDLQVRARQGANPNRVELCSDGQVVAAVLHSDKLFRQAPLPAGGQLLQDASGMLVSEFFRPLPLQRELDSSQLVHEGLKRVADVECDVVHATYNADGGAVRWFFGQVDHLPRRVERIFETPMGEASLITEINKLALAPTVTDERFRTTPPAGFRAVGDGGLLAVGTPAPDWKLKNADGQEVALASLRGKIVVMDFWATWCGPCVMAMPTMQALYEQYKDRPVAVFGINCRERGPSNPAAFFKSKGHTYPVLLEGDAVANAYLVSGIPAFYVIGPDGRVLYAHAGLAPGTKETIRQLIERHAPKSTSQPAAP